jgi:putative transposase
MLVTRVERLMVDMNQQLIDLSYASKNLYNCATFILRQNFIKNHKIINRKMGMRPITTSIKIS